jgi:hypothetical protein
MAASLDNSLIPDLRFDLTNLEKFHKEVALISRLSQRALFCPDKSAREKAQARIYRRYGGTITHLNVSDERIVFTIRSVKQILGKKPEIEEYPCTLCKLPDYLLGQPYHPVLFFE